MEVVLSNPVREQKAVSDGVIGMIFLLATEVMFFAGLISAYIVNRAGIMVWPPYGQPRLPVEVTAVNTAVLIVSAVTIFLFKRNFKSNLACWHTGFKTKKNSLKLLIITTILGGVFIIVQGTEWVKLIHYGLTTTSSLYGAFFYVLIGAHALHVVAGLAILLYLFTALKNSSSPEVARNKITVCSMYWYFVVGIWPILYILVYLM